MNKSHNLQSVSEHPMQVKMTPRHPVNHHRHLQNLIRKDLVAISIVIMIIKARRHPKRALRRRRGVQRNLDQNTDKTTPGIEVTMNGDTERIRRETAEMKTIMINRKRINVVWIMVMGRILK